MVKKVYYRVLGKAYVNPTGFQHIREPLVGRRRAFKRSVRVCFDNKLAAIKSAKELKGSFTDVIVKDSSGKLVYPKKKLGKMM